MGKKLGQHGCEFFNKKTGKREMCTFGTKKKKKAQENFFGNE